MHSIEIIGFAVVRGIDGNASRIFVATPVPAYLVKLVTCVVLPGSLHTRPYRFLRARRPRSGGTAGAKRWMESARCRRSRVRLCVPRRF